VNAGDMPPLITDWRDIRKRASILYAEGFHRSAEQDEIVALSPNEWGKPRFDNISQELIVPIYDPAGREIPLVLAQTPENSDAISLMEGRSYKNVLGILGLLRLNNKRLIVEPVTLYEAAGYLNLTLDSTSTKPLRSSATAVWEDEPREDTDPEPSTDDPSSPIGLLIASLESQLELIAESGIGAAGDVRNLKDLATKAESVGLQSIAKPISLLIELLRRRPEATGIPEAILKAYYLCRVASTHALLHEV
jgi:hypothetical protein